MCDTPAGRLIRFFFRYLCFMSVTSNLSEETLPSVDFSTYLSTFREKLRTVFDVRADVERISQKRGLPPFVMREVQSCTPLSVFIPEEYGGRGGKVAECQSMLEACSYQSLALSLTMGINGALFIQPVAKYAQDEIKQPIFRRFIEDKNMGGLMITEPDYGTDALNMKTSFVEKEDHYHIQGTKHWAGLTGWADFWLVTARRRNPDGQLGRDINFFVTDMNAGGQEIEVEEFYHNLGLYMIPYGRNHLDIQIPKDQRLEPTRNGVLMMLDLLHRSRTQFPGMGMGFLRRMLDEALEHCRERFVGGRSLFEYDQVKERLARLQASFTACSALCAYATEHASLENDLSRASVPANSIKTLVTDMMQDAAQSLLQLTGAKGYRIDHIAGRSVVDSRPFQIFEGSNDVLYQQISEAVLKQMKRMKESNLHAYLAQYDLTSRAADHFKDSLDFNVDFELPQRKLVELGEMLSRIISMECTIELGERGFRGDLISNCLTVFRQDVETKLTSFRERRFADIIDDYLGESKWLNYVSFGN